MRIHRQHQFVAAFFNEFLRQVGLIFFDETLADFSALGEREGISHRPADQHLIAFVQTDS